MFAVFKIQEYNIQRSKIIENTFYSQSLLPEMRQK